MNEKTILLYLELFMDNQIQNIISLNRDIPAGPNEIDFKKMFNEHNFKIDDKIQNDSINDHFYLNRFNYI